MLARNRVALAFVALCAAASASAETTVPSIDEATYLQRVAAAPRVRALELRARAARAAVGASSTLPNPTLSYEREAVPSLDAHDDFVRLGFTLDVAGRRGLARDAARASADAERSTVQHAELAATIDARLAFLDAIFAREHLARLDDARTSLAAVVDALRTRATQGDASSYDFDRAALELELLDDERATARRELAVARLRIGAFVGEPTTAYDASGKLDLPAVPSPIAPQRADLEAARARERQAKHELTAARRGWIPRLELMAGMLASTTGSANGIGYVVGIGGELPIFDAGGANASRARAEALRWRGEADALASEANAEVEQARLDLRMRIEQADAYARGPAKRSLDLMKRVTVAYREGDRPILELLDVQRTARAAIVQALRLAYDARRAELLLVRALGRKP